MSYIKWASKEKLAGFSVKWLDAGAYVLRDKINAWLDESGISYKHQQNVKWFVWHFEGEEDTLLFMIKWTS